MHRKRPHSKSRLGCLRCKSRRIKCDERKPKCNHCERYSATCEYPTVSRISSSQVSVSASGKPSTSPISTRSISLPRELEPETTVLSLTDLKLIHNWTLEAHKGFARNVVEEPFWQTELPQLAYEHPFLMHILLAISSLHLAQTSPEMKDHHLAIAASHHSVALPAYRYAIKDLESSVDEQRGRAMVSFASLTAVYALLCPPPAETGLSIQQLAESFLLLRGAREVLAVVGDCTEGCTMSSRIRGLYGDVDFANNPDDDRLAILEDKLLQAVQPHSASFEMEQANREALYMLRWCFAMLHNPVSSMNIKEALNIWIELVPPAYIDGLRQLEPGALVVLAHWCIMLKQAAWYWYLQDSAEQILSSICVVLSQEWQEAISWPLQVVCSEG